MKDLSFLLKTKEIEVNGVKIKCKEITAKQREALVELQEKSGTTNLWAANLIVMGCDEFKDYTPDQILDSASDQTILSIAYEIANLSGIGEEKKP